MQLRNALAFLVHFCGGGGRQRWSRTGSGSGRNSGWAAGTLEAIVLGVTWTAMSTCGGAGSWHTVHKMPHVNNTVSAVKTETSEQKNFSNIFFFSEKILFSTIEYI